MKVFKGVVKSRLWLPRAAQERPKEPQEAPPGGPHSSLQEPFWNDFGPSGDHLNPISKDVSSIFAARPNGGPEKLSKKAFQQVFQAICSSRPATVERSIIITIMIMMMMIMIMITIIPVIIRIEKTVILI